MKIGKIIASITACFFVAVCFTGCGGKNKPVASFDENDLDVGYDVSATLTVGITADPKEKTMIESLAEEFNQIYPNVEVRPVILQNELIKEIGQRVAAGTVPDIVFSTSETNYALISYNVFENLEPYIKYEEKTVPAYRDQFYEYFMKLGQKGLDGDQYVMPRSADRVVTHLNTRILKEAGVDMTKVKNGWSWSDFLNTCEKVREYFDSVGRRNQYVLDSYINWEAVMYPVFRSFGVDIFDDKGNVIMDKNPAAQQALDLMKELVDKRYIAPLNAEGSANYEGGQGAMLFHSAPVQKYYGVLGADYDLVTFPLIGDNPKIGAGLAGYGLSSRSANKAIGWKFLSFMVSRDGQNALARGGLNSMPIRKDLVDYTVNEWGKNYSGINLSAYSYKMEYNQATDFYLVFEPEHQMDVIDTLSDLVTNYLNGQSYSKAMGTFKISVADLT